MTPVNSGLLLYVAVQMIFQFVQVFTLLGKVVVVRKS